MTQLHGAWNLKMGTRMGRIPGGTGKDSGALYVRFELSDNLSF